MKGAPSHSAGRFHGIELSRGRWLRGSSTVSQPQKPKGIAKIADAKSKYPNFWIALSFLPTARTE